MSKIHVSRPLRSTPAVLALAVVALVSTSISASAAPPPDGDACSSGYVSTISNSNYAGAAVPQGDTVDEQVWNEVVGIGCFKRKGKKGTLKFRWYTTGSIRTGIFYYQVFDCTTKKVAKSYNIAFEEPTSTKSGKKTKKVTLKKSHKYTVRVTGGGSYDRAPAGDSYSSAGKWNHNPPEGIVSFDTHGACK